jgi:hypothetical protein
MRSRSPGAVLLAMVCAVVLGVTSMLTSAFVFGAEKMVAQIKLLAGDAGSFGLVMGGTGNPTPDTPYFDAVVDKYLLPNFPIPFDDYHALPTPEQFCPFVCVPAGGAPGGIPPFPLPAPLDPNDYPPNLTFGSSVTTGAGILNQAIRHNLDSLQNGNEIVVSGYSQSGTVGTLSMNDLIAKAEANDGAGTTGWPTLDELKNLHVVLNGDPNTPIGGILDRFQFPDGIQAFSLSPAPQHVPFVNIPLSLAPTPTTDIPADVYTGEYDAYASFPQDPTNILADINALIGIVTVHPFYPTYTEDQLASAIDVGTIGDTHFYDIPENLPILQFMFNGGTAGQFFGDFFSPWARLFIDWGYGNAGDPAVDGLYKIPGGANIEGSPFEQEFGVAGGPWAATPLGTLYDGSALTSVADSGIAGLFEKMDPLQMLAGIDNAFIQSIIGPWVDVAVGAGGPLSAGDIGTINGVIDTLHTVTGYDLINLVDQGLINGWNDLANGLDVGDYLGPAAILDGPLIPGQPLIDLVGGVFDIFNFFGA